MINLRESRRFTERLTARGISENEPIPLDPYGFLAVSENEIWDKIDKRVIPRDYFREAMQSRANALETSIRKFRECGVEMSRFSIEEHPGESRLCVDGIARFAWRLTV